MQKRFCVLFIFNLLYALGYSQDTDNTPDLRYLEDQFYVGVTYNLLFDRPDGVNQRNLPYGLQAGFVKDIPINSRRNIGFGIGLGYAIDSYFSNIRATEGDTGIIYTIIEDNTSFRRSKVETHQIEFPIQFRWRTSTATDFKFWRVYTGVTLGYVFASRSRFISDDERISFSNPDIQDFQYGLSLHVGYNTFNIQAYYSLSGLFDDSIQLDSGAALAITPFRVGIVFFIL